MKMKRQTNLHTIKLLSLAMVAAITIIIAAAFPASAQDQPPYKVGDRVGASTVFISNVTRRLIICNPKRKTFSTGSNPAATLIPPLTSRWAGLQLPPRC